MRPIIDLARCTGCWTCDHVCPEVFQVREDGHAYVINDNPSEDLDEAILRARRRCDFGAISIEGYPDEDDEDED